MRKIKKTRKELKNEFQKLKFTSDFMFSELMKQEDLCKALITNLLDIEIDSIVYHKPQKSFRYKNDAKGVRFDVYVKDSDRVFDIEIQVNNYDYLPLRARYYQANMDLDSLKRKEQYKNLPENYILFICTGDPFGKGHPVYTVRNMVEEDPDLIYNDKCRKIYYNSKAWEKCKNENLKSFLRYLSTQNPTSTFTEELDSKLDLAKKDKRVLEKFMTLRMKINEEREEAKLEAINETTARLQPVIDSLKLENSSLQNKNTSLQNENTSLQDENTSLQNENQKKDNRIAELEAMIAEMKK